MMPGPKVQRVDLATGSVAFTDQGSGPCVVLGHSFLFSRSMWSNQLPELVSRYRVINIDYRGHGESSPITKPFTMYDLLHEVLAVLDVCGVQRAVWAGLSTGGFVALRAALTVPDRVSGLILLDTDAGPEQRWPRAKYRILGAIARWFGLGAVTGAATRQMFGASTLRAPPDFVNAWQREFQAMDVPSTLFFLRALSDRDDLRHRLSAIDAPALVMVGREDVSLPIDRSEQLARALPHAELRIVAGSGHLSALEQGPVVTEAMLAFLASVTANGPPGSPSVPQ